MTILAQQLIGVAIEITTINVAIARMGVATTVEGVLIVKNTAAIQNISILYQV